MTIFSFILLYGVGGGPHLITYATSGNRKRTICSLHYYSQSYPITSHTMSLLIVLVVFITTIKCCCSPGSDKRLPSVVSGSVFAFFSLLVEILGVYFMVGSYSANVVTAYTWFHFFFILSRPVFCLLGLFLYSNLRQAFLCRSSPEGESIHLLQ